MADYIEREAAIKAAQNDSEYDSVEMALRCVPAADVRPVVRGLWIGIDDFPHESWECDHCGCVVENISDPWNHYHFCPNCGTDMRSK